MYAVIVTAIYFRQVFIDFNDNHIGLFSIPFAMPIEVDRLKYP